MSRRTERLNELFRQELSGLLQREMRDPRFKAMTTITAVEISLDLHYAKVFVSIMAEEPDKQETLAALRSATRFLRRRLGERIVLRTMPELQFIPDDSLERAAHLLELIDQVAGQTKADRPSEPDQ